MTNKVTLPAEEPFIISPSGGPNTILPITLKKEDDVRQLWPRLQNGSAHIEIGKRLVFRDNSKCGQLRTTPTIEKIQSANSNEVIFIVRGNTEYILTLTSSSIE